MIILKNIIWKHYLNNNFKKHIQATARYKRIVKNLKDQTVFPYMSFVVIISSDFRMFFIPFQTSAPMIQVLHVKMMKLLKSVLVKCIYSVYLKSNGVSHAVNEYIQLDVTDLDKHKAQPEIGANAKSLLSNLDLQQQQTTTKWIFSRKKLSFV